jgi:hypothetical protein
VRCATSAVAAVRDLGIEIRAGLHTGEVELDDTGVGGIAVHIGARIASLAGPSEVLVSSTVKDLVAGAALEFEDRGEHKLKGVPGSGASTASLPETDRSGAGPASLREMASLRCRVATPSEVAAILSELDQWWARPTPTLLKLGSRAVVPLTVPATGFIT